MKIIYLTVLNILSNIIHVVRLTAIGSFKIKVAYCYPYCCILGITLNTIILLFTQRTE